MAMFVKKDEEHTALRRKSKNWLAVNPTGCYFSELTQ
jgi:hypothetical protein